jgi:hypothetical protein
MIAVLYTNVYIFVTSATAELMMLIADVLACYKR